MSVIVYGDIHGCLDEFKTLRAKVSPTESDIEVIVGDILDRGPDSNALLSYVAENKIISILGNHEYKYIRYKKHHDIFLETGKKNPIELDDEKLKIFNVISEQEFEYLKSLRFFIKIDNLTIIHAGITNDIDLENATLKELERILWIRTLDVNKKPLALGSENKDAKLWTEYYDGQQGIIIYGHQTYESVQVDKFSIGIDTGCVYGNKLSACIISDTKNPIQNYTVVDTKSTYKEKK